MTNWDTLKSYLEIHAALESDITVKMVLEYMKDLEDEEKRFTEQLTKEKVNKEEGFLYTGVPDFDQNAWKQILEEKGLQGLA